ncbi:MAG: single-stranded-DNA-specific exonuclease [Desulfobulbaceae bacterium]|nr:MAG: single-stranded-DNA-specific exonuclease [Desulfobulbaceae bacterium]
MSIIAKCNITDTVQWRVLPLIDASPELQQIAKEKNLHPITVKLLAQRGYQKKKDIEDFLEPKLANLPNPLDMKGMTEAAAIASQAVMKKTPILIWGDYDVDGATGTALLVTFFRALGIEAQYVVPNRITHGYGLHTDLLRSSATTRIVGEKLLITVDCGISAHEEILAAQEMGYQVIVTDHHEPPQEICPAEAILNPKQISCEFPTEELAGVGVAFYLACGVRQSLRELGFFNGKKVEPDVRDLLDLVALGTIADMVPLGRINRVLVKEGLQKIEQLKRTGIRAMLGLCGLLDSQKKINGNIRTEDIGFLLAPMINAAGRLADAGLAVQLLLSQNSQESMVLAQKLLDLNSTRKSIGQEVYTQALAMHSKHNVSNKCYILSGEFHHGVIGIVASRLVETLGIPVILFSEEKNSAGQTILKGSGRSVPGVDLHAALEQCSELLARYGGHAMAAGLTLNMNELEVFRENMNKEIGKQMHINNFTRLLTIDMEVEIDELASMNCGLQLQLMEPFGPGNSSPVFLATKSTTIDVKTMGAENLHLKLTLERNGLKWKGIAFKMGAHLTHLRADKNPMIAYSPMANRFRDKLTWEAKVLGIQPQPKRGEPIEEESNNEIQGVSI